MKPAVVTRGIVLRRVNYAEADRILTFLTPDHGKVAVIAKGVRKSKSKLAGGIELFSVSDITYIPGRGDIGTLISTRLQRHYGNIVKEVNRTDIAYDVIRKISKITEEAPERGYFDLLMDTFEALDDLELNADITSVWFNMQLLKLSGHAPNLQTDLAGNKLEASKKYNFHFDDMKFGTGSEAGSFEVNQIKFLRLGFAAASARVLAKVHNSETLIPSIQPVVQQMLRNYVQV